MNAVLANPRGSCAGVTRAVEIVERALELYGTPVYVLHEIVHNQHVLEDLRHRGAVFTEDLNEIPPGSVVVFSAHGVSNAVVETAQHRGLEIVDATCPLVTKVHFQAQRYSQDGYEMIIIGHAGHVEVEGTRGRIPGTVHVVGDVEEARTLEVKNPERIAYVTQTTLSLDDTQGIVDVLKHRFPHIRGPELSDICYATQNRQNAIKKMASQADLLLVVGARNSSNSNRLQEVGWHSNLPSYLIQDVEDLDPAWFTEGMRVGITAGASTPEALVQRILEQLRHLGVQAVREMEGVQEDIVFRLPSSVSARKKEPQRTRTGG